MSTETSSATPWYKQFWPWFIIALPATVVVAALTTVYIAFKNADTLVNDNYYKDGLAINQSLAQDRLAAKLGMAARVRFDFVSAEVWVEVNQPFTESMELLLLHPVDQDRDRKFQLVRAGNGRFRADLRDKLANRYYVRLQSGAEGGWRLNGDVDFDQTHQFNLQPNG